MTVCSFLTRYRKGVNLDRKGSREELGRVRGGTTIIGIQCIKNLFSTKENKMKTTTNVTSDAPGLLIGSRKELI